MYNPAMLRSRNTWRAADRYLFDARPREWLLLLFVLFLVPASFGAVVFILQPPKDFANSEFWMATATYVFISLGAPYGLYIIRKNREASIEQGREPIDYSDKYPGPGAEKRVKR